MIYLCACECDLAVAKVSRMTFRNKGTCSPDCEFGRALRTPVRTRRPCRNVDNASPFFVSNFIFNYLKVLLREIVSNGTFWSAGER